MFTALRRKGIRSLLFPCCHAQQKRFVYVCVLCSCRHAPATIVSPQPLSSSYETPGSRIPFPFLLFIYLFIYYFFN
ncbi:hypothetical protein GGI43DRAFT_415705 [Trichoderma evansii]